MKNSQVNGFISLLLNKNPEIRLGGSYNNLKSHQFFSSVKWVNIFLFSMN